ncbi:MAG: plasmid mobilization relaxosome protein MobC [Oscillospiraceae bacterium]|nr:plasmid mobilization relaxosome protein MobC [Oscillospiraceae bacterium]
MNEKRTIKKQLWVSKAEDTDIKEKAGKTCLSEAALIRLLIKGYKPKEKPDDRFYEAMRQLSSIANNLNQLVAKAHSLGFIDAQTLDEEVIRWHQFQADIERQFLRPEDDRKRWQ